MAGRSRVSQPKQQDKPLQISKWVVWEAYQRVKANQGAAGVDEQSIQEFEGDLKGNLYKLWNRLSSGSYFPPPVKAVEIPKPGGKGCGSSGCPPWRTESPKPSCGCTWSRVWSRACTLTPTGIGRGGRRWTRWRHAGNAAGGPTGSSTWTSRRSSTACRGTWWSGRSPTTPTSGGSCCMWSGGSRRRCNSRTAPWSRGIVEPAGVGDLTPVGEPVLALRVRCVDGPGVSGHLVRAVLRRRGGALRQRAAGPAGAGCDRWPAGETWAGVASGQDAHRVVQGR
jgi:hypothetical protein